MAFARDRSDGRRTRRRADRRYRSCCCVSPHYPWYFAWLIVFACLVPSARAAVVDLASFLLYLVPVGSQLVRGRTAAAGRSRSIYGPFVALAAPTLKHGGAAAGSSLRHDQRIKRRAIDPRRYFEHIGDGARPARRGRAGLPLSGDDQPLQPAVHDLPAHLRGARTAGGHELGAVHRDRRPVPQIARVVLHGVGEPMMVPALPRMIRYLKDRGTYVLFNTNGTLLTERKGRELIDSGLDELRVSLDAAEPRRLQAGARARHVRPHRAQRARLPRNAARARGRAPRVSLWLTGLKETVDQLGEFVRLAHDIGCRARSICSGSCISPRDKVWRGRIGAVCRRRRCRGGADPRRRRAGARSRRRVQRLGCDRPGKPVSSPGRRRSPGHCVAARGP